MKPYGNKISIAWAARDSEGKFHYSILGMRTENLAVLEQGEKNH